MHFSTLFTALLSATAVTAAPPQSYKPAPYKPAPKGLWKAMQARGRNFIGTAITLRNPPDTKEAALYGNTNDFNSMTPENAMKWESTEPTRNNFTFADADRHADYAKSKGYQIHCHTLVWHSQLPTWVSEGGFDNKTLIAIMKQHISKVAGRYKGRCTRWDVVNEALNEDGTYRESVFYNTIGEAYIPIAFAHTAKVDPNARLFYNDYNTETNGAKTAGAARIVDLVKSYGVKINGVGVQAHVAIEQTPTAGPAPPLATLIAALKQFTSRGVDVAYTEIDARMLTPYTPAKAKLQSQVFERMAKSCLAVKRCVGMTVWSVSDKYSWIPDVFEGEGAALLWGKNYDKKPAYNGFLNGIVTG